MDVRAILIVDGGDAERFAGRPLGLLDVLGQPLVERVAARLRNFGAEKITILSEREPFAPHFGYPNGIAALHWQHISDDGLWRACEQVFNDNAHEGAEIILVWRLGAYAEVNLEDLVQFHLDSKNRVTPVMDDGGWLGIFAISASGPMQGRPARAASPSALRAATMPPFSSAISWRNAASNVTIIVSPATAIG